MLQTVLVLALGALSCRVEGKGVRVPITSITVEFCPWGLLGCERPGQHSVSLRNAVEGAKVQLKNASYGVSDTELYVAEFSVGNPPQKFNLTLNSDTFWTTVFNKGLKQIDFCKQERDASRRFFDSSRSTTLRYTQRRDKTDVDAVFGNRNCLTGETTVALGFSYFDAFSVHVSDDMRVGGRLAKSVPFALALDFDNYFTPSWASDGVLGLKFDMGFVNQTSAVQALAQAAGDPVVSFHFQRPSHLSPSISPLTGTMLIGAKDLDNCEDNWMYFPSGMTTMQVNSVPVLQSRFGSVVAGGTALTAGVAVLEVRQTAIVVDFSLFDNITKEIGAHQENPMSAYLVECSKVDTFPDLVLTLVNEDQSIKYDYHVSPRDYVGNVVPRTDGKCALLIQESAVQTECLQCSIGCACGVNWILGTAAARSHCWLYDYEKQQVAIARAKAH